MTTGTTPGSQSSPSDTDGAAPSLRRIVVLISGSGSNLQALLDAAARNRLGGGQVVAVISNKPQAGGLQRAAAAGIPGHTLNHKDFADRPQFDQALGALIDQHQPDLVVLAGFMRILTEAFVRRYAGRLLNIHPSLLPAYPGLHTHQRAIADGVREHGATVHFVTPELDGGPPFLQGPVPVQPEDDSQQLAARVLVQEHRIYPAAVRWFCQGRLRLGEQGPLLDNQLLHTPVNAGPPGTPLD